MRNAQAVGEVSLKKGLRSEKFGLRAIPDEEKPEILKAYLDQFKTTVQRYSRCQADHAPPTSGP